jgi:hypothetical protein
MSGSSRVFLWVVALLVAWAPTATLQAQEQEPAQLWADFNHYVLVARPQLAADAGQALLEQVDNAQLLKIVEGSDYADKYPDVLDRAVRTDATSDVAKQLRQRIQSARIDQSRDEERIARNIELLDEGTRPYRNAVERLKAAGQFAVPQMLATLQDASKEDLHPFVVNALVAMGKPVAPPLAAALPELPAVKQGQVAQVLARVGHPYPLPALKALANNEEADADARNKARQAVAELQRNSDWPTDARPARLFLLQGQQQYRQATGNVQQMLGYDPAQDKGILWAYDQDAGLIDIPVPGVIYGDVLAMRSARSALELNQGMSPALSLYLMANLRRENRLPQGTQDPSYGQDMRPPSFYAMVAGPARLHDVLSQALSDRDAALALDAIEALSKTAGTDSLVQQRRSTQPLLRALSFPDRRVRFRAAEALAQARPQQSFRAANRVVPALGEVVRPEEARYAVVLANGQERRNQLLSVLNDLGYEAVAGRSLPQVQQQIEQRAGVDLIVTEQAIGTVGDLVRESQRSPLLAGSAILALAGPGDQIRLNQAFGDEPRVHSAVASDNAAVRSAVENTMADYTGVSLDEQTRTEYALRALEILRQLAIASPVYDVTDIQSILINAVDDPRNEVAVAAGRVLAVLDTKAAQRAIAEQALVEENESVKIAMLGSLAESANAFGNRVKRNQESRLNDLVNNSEGELAVAAGQAHGALQLPTANAVELIVAGDSDQ